MPAVGLTHTTGLPAPLLSRLRASQRGDERPQDPTTTELINPTRLTYLQRTVHYTEKASDCLYRLLGQVADELLTDDAGEVLTQERLRDAVNSGKFDRYEADTQDLIDWKMTGFYKVKRCHTEGMWLGAREWCLQLNDYRMKLEALGFPVKRVRVFAMVRDHGWMAKKAGITEPWYWLEVGRISDRWIHRYFTEKKRRLELALHAQQLPVVCTKAERWYDKRCKNYCPVAFACPHGKAFVSAHA